MGKCASKQQRHRHQSYYGDQQLQQQILNLYHKNNWNTNDSILSISEQSLILIIENGVSSVPPCEMRSITKYETLSSELMPLRWISNWRCERWKSCRSSPTTTTQNNNASNSSHSFRLLCHWTENGFIFIIVFICVDVQTEIRNEEKKSWSAENVSTEFGADSAGCFRCCLSVHRAESSDWRICDSHVRKMCLLIYRSTNSRRLRHRNTFLASRWEIK